MFKIKLRNGGRQLRKKEIDEVICFFNKCRECGEREIWKYGNARDSKLCRECYRSEDIPHDVLDKIWLYIDSIDGKNLREHMYQKLVVEHWRGVRNKKGIYEPEIECAKCKKDKPLFEFKTLYNPICRDCAYIINGARECRGCNKHISLDLMEDDEYIYYFCPTCREERKIEKDFLYFNTVSYRQRKQMLGRSGLDETKESLEFCREAILAKRLNYEIKRQIKKQKKEMKNESNRKHVSRK